MNCVTFDVRDFMENRAAALENHLSCPCLTCERWWVSIDWAFELARMSCQSGEIKVAIERRNLAHPSTNDVPLNSGTHVSASVRPCLAFFVSTSIPHLMNLTAVPRSGTRWTIKKRLRLASHSSESELDWPDIRVYGNFRSVLMPARVRLSAGQ